ncbi:MAG: hypothetical protein ABEI86_02300, partial [Halobacteriaceae archaeon]
LAVVIKHSDISISEWEVSDDDERTVAADNPEYDEDEDTVLVVFESYFDGEFDNWKEIGSEDLYEEVVDRDIKFYAFPESRLEVVKDPSLLALEEIKEMLDDRGFEPELEDDVLVVEKFGEEHYIRPDGSVEGGKIADNLETLIENQ